MVEKPISLGIKSKITLVGLFLSLGTLFSVSLLSFIAADNILKDRIQSQLVSESTGRGASIRALIDTRVQQIALLATNNRIDDIVSQIIMNPASMNGSGNNDYNDQFNKEFKSFQEVAGNSMGLESIQVVGKDGKVLLSSNSTVYQQQTNNKNNNGIYIAAEQLQRGLKESFLEFDQQNGQRKAIVMVPIKSSFAATADGNRPMVAVMVASTSTSSFDDILLNRKGLGETGEVYLVNQNKVMISESRFIENAPFKVKVDTLPVNECFNKGTEIFDVYPDYRGISIVGSSYCARDKGFVLLAEFDEAEIFSPITQLRNAILATAAVITAVVVINSFYVAKTISKPITKLRDAADRISKGDYEHEIGITSRDEVGQLALQFDNMRKSVLETNLNLNRIVRERTKELSDMTNALDATAIVAVTDKDGTITKVNRKFVEISKYAEQELISQNHRILKSGYHSVEFFENMWKTITSGQIFEGEIKNKAKDGSYYWVKTTIVPFLGENGRPKQYIAIHNDITNLKNIEERLHEALERDRANTEIIRRQVEELQKTNLELRRKDKLKDEFLSMASHELKTPLTPIIGWCGALKSNKILGAITSSQRSAVEIIEKNAIKLEKMVSDMLDVQKIELNEMKFSINEVNVGKLFKNVEKDFQFMMGEKNIQFKLSANANLLLRSDEARIMQVLSALLYNSVDFVPKRGGKIEVTATESDDSKNIIFCVRDNGPGIPKDKQEFLFKKFYQVDTSLTRKHGGTGLGLAISKGIVTGLGGTIWVETEEGKGSSFYFSLPKEIKQNENSSNR